MKTLFFLCLLLSAQTMYSQSIELFDIDTSNFPTMKAKFFAFDATGNQVRPSASELALTENGVMRTITNINCPPPVPLKAVSVAMSIDVSGSMGGANFGDIPVELGKTTASELCKSITMPPSEFALQTCDHRAMIIQDFTTQRSKILDGITPIRAVGDNDFVEHLLNTLTGLLHIAKTGKHKRVAVLYTDAWWYALSSSELQQCIQLCKEHAIEFYAVIYSRPEAEPNGIKQSLQALAVATGGILYDGITSEKAAKDIGFRIQQVAQGGSPCRIEWQSGISCQAGNTNVELQWQAQKATDSYQSPQSTIAKLEFNPKSIKFADPQVGVRTEQKITVTARNADFNITNITSNNGGFDITPKNFILPNGQSIELTVSYTPADSGFNYCRFEIENTLCQTRLYASGGWKGKKPSIRTLKLIHPNGGEVFVAGSDTVITWEGISPDEPVKLEYRISDTQPWKTITDSAKGFSHPFKVPRIASKQYLARVTSAAKSGSENGMVRIPEGTFQMGNTGTYGGLHEKSERSVTISRDFLMSMYEITQKQYEEVMGTNPSNFKGENLPVENVTWYEAVEYCNKLSEKEGLDKCYSGSGNTIVCDWDANGYRLPTEAEWEYAAKAGTTTDFYSGDVTNQYCTPIDRNLDTIGWYCGNSNDKTQEVGQKAPNDFGLYDMTGNVWEWCWDWYGSYTNTPETDPRGPVSGSYRVRRGGSWFDDASFCRSAFRNVNYPTDRIIAVGFRVVRPR